MSRKTGHQRPPDHSLLVIPCFSRHLDVLAWAQERLVETYGELALVSRDFSFHHTKYYEKTMGQGLKKRFLVFARLNPSDILPDVKNFTIGLEQTLAQRGDYAEKRPLNLDPGLLQLGKFLLATTKDQGHRIYLRDGIYAEVTLRFEGDAFEPWPWTYADYREPEVRAFLKTGRDFLSRRIQELSAAADQPSP